MWDSNLTAIWFDYKVDWKERLKKEGKAFASDYISILGDGGSKKPETLLAEHDLDIRSPKFWQAGFDYIKTQVKELESLS